MLLLIAGGGAPYVMLAAGGLRYAPAHDQAALSPGFAPLFVALISAVWWGEALAPMRKIGLALILAGALAIVFGQGLAWTGTRSLGHVLFLTASLLWACFTVIMRRAEIAPIHGSTAIYLPAYILHGPRRAELPIVELGNHAFYQGVMVTVVPLILYGRAVTILGASAFAALVPALSALLAIPLLGEWPTTGDWVVIILVSIGVYLTSGGPTTWRKPD